jgi:hypothetical protein
MVRIASIQTFKNGRIAQLVSVYLKTMTHSEVVDILSL